MIRYEDFVKAPDDVLGAVCAFLDEPFEIECLDQNNSDRKPQAGDYITAQLVCRLKIG